MMIRQAVEADAPAIARIHVDTWRSAYQVIVPASHLAALSYTKSEASWRARLVNTSDGSFTYVAERDGQPVGFAWGGPERDGSPDFRGELYAIYVLKQRQGCGLGKRLVTAVAGRLSGQGINSLLIWVLADNRAKRFYEKLGGLAVAERPASIGGVDLTEVAYGWRDTGSLARQNTILPWTRGGPR